MKYWPLSVIASSPLMPHAYVWEMQRIYAQPVISFGAATACNQIAAQTVPVEATFLIVETVGAGMRRVYAEYPEFEEWLRLERGGFVATDDSFGLVIDALH